MKKVIIVVLTLIVTLSGKSETLTLSQCLEKAKANNRELQNAALEIQSAGELQKEAYTKYFPQVSANVMAFHAFDKMVKADGTYPKELAMLGQINPAFAGLATLAGQPWSYSALDKGYAVSAMAMEPLYAGGKITTANRLAAVQRDCRELQLSLKEKDVLQKVTENFWHIATIKYQLHTIEAAEKQMVEVFRNATNYVNAGITTRNAVLKVKLRQQELASDRLKLENSEHILLMLLAQQIGEAQFGTEGLGIKDFDIVLPGEDATPTLPDHASIDKADSREELLLAAKNVEVQQYQIRMERSKMLPTLAVGVMGYHTGIGGFDDILGRKMNINWTNGLALATLSIPISEWWSSNHAVRRAKIKVQQAKNDYIEAHEKLIIDNEVAWSNLTEAFKQISIAHASVEDSEENLRMSMNRYQAGVETINDLLDAETLNRKSHGQLSSAIADYYIRLADYQRKTQ